MCFYCFCIFYDGLENMSLSYHLKFIDYFEWLIQNINDKNLYGFLLSDKIDLISLLSYLIEFCENLSDEIITSKVIHILISILADLMQEEKTNDLLSSIFDELNNIICDNKQSEDEKLKERIFVLSTLLNIDVQ